ncbi:Gar1/Naf1 RNA binding region-domain-containing protein [Aspergillus ambiguus]|uniref:RNA-binding snoRNP assembly protein NAF1 n=1 Tax=Aspergillus ambiguus TaxID=176160 RepID=UPI003CCE19EF
MSDQKPPSIPSVDSQANVSEGLSVKANDAPVASTPDDDGSDFYNTPLVAGTPVTKPENVDSVAKSNISDPPSSTAAPAIPGLSLVNDGSKDQETIKSELGVSQNTADMEIESRLQKEDTSAKEPAAENNESMQVDQTNESHNEVSVTSGANVSSAEQAQDDQMEEEHPEWEIDSSPYESSDSSSTDSSDDSDDDEDYEILSPEEQARILMQAELGSDDEGDGKGKSGAQIKSANELPEEAPPIPEVTITPEMKIVLLGHVEAVVENTVLIAASTSGEYQVLETGSLLCHEDRTVAGVVSETLGRVENPLYAVRYPSAAAVEEHGISQGKVIYYVEELSTFVFTQPLKGMKGSDASNFHDEEIAEDEVEFSDDEAEAEYKRKLKQKRQERKEAKGDGARARRGPPGPSKLSQSELNYDDNAAEDGYTPLARPKNLHEMMGHQEAPVEADGPPSRGAGFRGRGRGRGFDRGRGGRGRGGPRDSHHHDRHSHNQHDASASQPTNYNQPQAFNPSQQNAYPLHQQFPFAPFLQPQQQQPQQQGAYPQGTAATPFNFQMPFLQPFQQQNPYQQTPHINPLFLAALQQQQQQQQQHFQQTPATGNQQPQQPTMNFDQVKAQLDLLRHLSNGNQGPPQP